jgi:hypothetical protein
LCRAFLEAGLSERFKKEGSFETVSAGLPYQVPKCHGGAIGGSDEAMVEKRLADHRRNPASAVPLHEMKTAQRRGYS